MSESPSQPRAKRQRVDKQGRSAAFAKLKSLKGQKNKVELSEEIDNVYDVVDEKEFVKRVQKYGTDWIEDDGTGYAEDGRDLFEDEDPYYSGPDEDSKKKDNKSKKRTRDGDQPVKGKSSIRNLFSNAVPKKKKDNVIKLEDDDVLADILGEIDGNKNTEKKEDSTNGNIKTATVTSKKSDDAIVKEYMQNFMENLKRTTEPKKEKGESEDDEIIERILKPKTKPPSVSNEDHLKPKEVVDKTIKIEKETIKENVTKSVATKEINSKKVEDIPEEFINIDDAFQDDDHFDNIDYSTLNNQPKEHEKKIEKPATIASPAIPKKSQIKTEEEEMKNLLNNWESICQTDDNFDNEIAAISNTQLTTDKTSDHQFSDKNLKFWYWDAWEDAIKRPGEVFLFGKMNYPNNAENKSICIHVENIERVLYLLPREYVLDSITKEPTKQQVTLMDVYNEFMNQIAPSLGVKTFKSEKVTKNFAFHLPGVDVPETCEYIEIRYNGKKPAPELKTKFNSIAHIFGTNTSFLETFLLERKIKGPGWLNISNFRIIENPLSWCKIEAKCSTPLDVKPSEDQKPPPPPPMVILAMNIKSVLNPKTNKNEIVMISCLVNNKFSVDKPPPNPPFNRHFCGFTRPANQNWPFDFPQKLSQYKSTKTFKFDVERGLLSWFLAIYQNLDPDLIVMHDIYDCQLDLICDRLAALKIPIMSRFGRLKLTQILSKKWKDFFIGRLVCDVKTSAEELIKSRSYDLDTLCRTVLKLKEGERMEISNTDLGSMYETSDSLIKLITLTMQDCSYVLKLMCEMNVLPLALQITSICGNLMSRTLQGGRSERNEFLLLHSFYEKNYIVPDKKKRSWENAQPSFNVDDGATQSTQANKTNAGNTTATRKKAAFAGGLVLEPIKGFYDKFILLMDFNSLYPSIIQEFNICFTTVPEPELVTDVPPLPDSTIEPGILPRQIRRLVESRREVKKLMAIPDLEPELKMQYNIRQLALKLTANSMYGCLGFAQSRFFAQHLASLVTSKGREILMNTKSLVQKLNFEVIYGDTDSIMVNTNSTDYEQVFKIGSSIKQIVNKIYRQIELDIDGVFKCLLLLKKKKYAAVTISKNSKNELAYQQEHKGLDIVRRDWSQISCMAGKLVLDEILSDIQLDEKIEAIHSHLEKFKQNILDGSVPLPLLAITKQLTKAPNEYTNNISGLPHVIVAKRMNDTRNKRYKKGDMVQYVICSDGTENAAMQRAYHLDEMKGNETLKVDTNYYLAQQIHPVVMRICEPLEGTDGARIAQSLGLDPNKFKAAAQRQQRDRSDEVGAGESITKTSLQKFRQCEKCTFVCITCNKDNVIASAFKPHEKSYIPVLQKCSNKECKASPWQFLISIQNQMILQIREFIKRFYDNWMICDEPTCNVNTRILTHVTINNRPVCLTCKNGVLIRSYSERDLYLQISYFQYMFDLSKHEHKNVVVPIEVEMAYNTLKETVDALLEKSAFNWINLKKLYAGLKPLDQSDVISDKTISNI